MNNKKECVKVAVRCRPLSTPQKLRKYQNITTINQQQGQIIIKNLKQHDQQQRIFSFDMVFGQNSQQQNLFKHAALPIVQSALEGYNGTIFAYGQTGTGKTYTMQGNLNNTNLNHKSHQQHKGIIPRTFQHIIRSIQGTPNTSFMIRVSMLQIYNQQIIDLLSEDRKNKLQIHQNKQQGIFVKDLTQYTVSNAKQMQQKLKEGSKLRHTGSTSMNLVSSRSHSIFIIKIEQQQIVNQQTKIKAGKLNLVDLAGSQRQKKSDGTKNRALEGIYINSALLTLGQVIGALTSHQNTHVPYRDSKLTRLLQQSLGGNAKTVMIANIGPASYNYKQTINTLRYASQTKKIKNRPKINEDPHDAIIKQYQQQIERLKEMLCQLQNIDSKVLKQRRQNQILNKYQKQRQSLQRQRHIAHNLYNYHQPSSSTRQLIERDLLITNMNSKQRKIYQQLVQKINHMNQKLLHGNKLKQQARLHQKRIFQAKQQLQQRKQLQRRLQNDFDRAVKAQQIVQYKNLSLKDQVQNRNKYLDKLDSKLKIAERQNNDILEFMIEQRQQLQEQNRGIVKELKLANLIIQKFVPLDKVAQILSAKINGSGSPPSKSCDTDFPQEQTIAMANSYFNQTQSYKTFHRKDNHKNQEQAQNQFNATGYLRNFKNMKTRGRQRQYINQSNQNYNHNIIQKKGIDSVCSKKQIKDQMVYDNDRFSTQNVRKTVSRPEIVTMEQWNSINLNRVKKQNKNQRKMNQTSYSKQGSTFYFPNKQSKNAPPSIQFRNKNKMEARIKQVNNAYKNFYQQNSKKTQNYNQIEEEREKALKQIYGYQHKIQKTQKSQAIKKKIFKKNKQIQQSDNSDDYDQIQVENNKQTFNKSFFNSNIRKNSQSQNEQQPKKSKEIKLPLNIFNKSAKAEFTPQYQSHKKLSKQQNRFSTQKNIFKVPQNNKRVSKSKHDQCMINANQISKIMKNLETQHKKNSIKDSICDNKENSPQLNINFRSQHEEEANIKSEIKRIIRNSEKSINTKREKKLLKEGEEKQIQKPKKGNKKRVINCQMFSDRSYIRSGDEEINSPKKLIKNSQSKQGVLKISNKSPAINTPSKNQHEYEANSNGFSTSRSKKSVKFELKNNKKSESMHSPLLNESNLQCKKMKRISTSKKKNLNHANVDQINEKLYLQQSPAKSSENSETSEQKNYQQSNYDQKENQTQSQNSSSSQQFQQKSQSNSQEEQNSKQSQNSSIENSNQQQSLNNRKVKRKSEHSEQSMVEKVMNNKQKVSQKLKGSTKSRTLTKTQKKRRANAPILNQIYGTEVEEQKKEYQKIINGQTQVDLQTPEIEIKKDSKFWISAQTIFNQKVFLFEQESLKYVQIDSNKHNLNNFRKIVKILCSKDQYLIYRLFQKNKQVNSNVYGVWLCNHYQWKCIIVNDMIPVDQKNKPLFSYHKKNQLWPIILEKALAVLLGGYKKLMETSTNNLFHIITGCNVNNFKLRQDISKNQTFFKYLSQISHKSVIIHAQKQCKSLEEHYEAEKMGKVYYVLGQKISKGQNFIQIQQELKDPQWLKRQYFVSKFKSVEVLHLRESFNFISIQVPQCKTDENLAVFQIYLNQSQNSLITLSNSEVSNLKLFVYKEDELGKMKLIGQNVQKSKKSASFQKYLTQGKYILFAESNKIKCRISYSGSEKISLSNKQNFTYMREMKKMK